MSSKRIRKTRCSDCDALVHHTGQPQQLRGVVLHPGFRYCTGSHRPRCFRSSDPKIHVPKWCPKRIQPAILRIYTFKNAQAEHLYNQMGGIFAFRYALRYTGTTNQPADLILEKGIPESHSISEGEVVEFDDGIQSVFFCMESGELRTITLFDKEMIAEIVQ